MKKLIISILLILLALSGFALPYAKRCTKCTSEYSKKHGCTTPAYMQRDFGTPHKKENGHVYTLYNCQYGHRVWVQLDDN